MTQENSRALLGFQLGTPYTAGAVRVALLGSGELGKELTIELQRLGVEVHACDSYDHAPAMQVAQFKHIIDMKDPEALRSLLTQLRPSFIVPELEAIATSVLGELEAQGYRVAPSAKAVQLTMDREGIRRLATEQLDLPTARFLFANDFESFKSATQKLGYPCVVKPLMSSSGKGQCVVRNESELEQAWQVSQTAGRTGAGRVIVEEFVHFESEITLLTVVTAAGTSFCEPIGHLQEGGDYVESWQPHPLTQNELSAAQEIAIKVTNALGGWGVFGVELFLLKDGRVLFSEVSPRPHDTGMVTMITQKFSQFALHARAVLGLPIPVQAGSSTSTAFVERSHTGASAALRARKSIAAPRYFGVEKALQDPQVELRLFGKPNAYAKRRMGVVLATGKTCSHARETAKHALSHIEID